MTKLVITFNQLQIERIGMKKNIFSSAIYV
jgi:hypothetical protein